MGKCPICGHRLTPDKLAGAKKVLKIGFLSAIAIIFYDIGLSPFRFDSNKDKAYLTLMKIYLHNLVTAEESYFADNATYTTTLPASEFMPSTSRTVTIGNATYTTTFPASELLPSTSVTVTIGAADSTGWNATATHSALPGQTCAVFGGTGPAVAPATNVGKVACTP